jgi:hypothetical protein
MPRIRTATANPMGKRPGTLISLHGMPRHRTRGLSAIMLPDGDGIYSPPIIVRGPIAFGSKTPTPATCDYAPPPPGCTWQVDPNSPDSCNAKLVCTGSDGETIPLIAPNQNPSPPGTTVVQVSPLPLVVTAPAATPAATITNPPLTPAPAPQNLVRVNQMPSSPQIAAASGGGSMLPAAAVPQVVYDPVTGQISIQQPSAFSSFLTWLESASIEESVLSEAPGSGALPNWGVLGIAAALLYAISGSSTLKGRR